MLTVLTVTVVIDLLLAVGIGMVMASFLFMQRITDMQIASMKTVTRPGDGTIYYLTCRILTTPPRAHLKILSKIQLNPANRFYWSAPANRSATC